MSAGDQDYTTGMRNPINKDQFAYLNMEIKALESERDRLNSQLKIQDGMIANQILEIDRLKAERDRDVDTTADLQLSLRRVVEDRDLWKSKAEKLAEALRNYAACKCAEDFICGMHAALAEFHSAEPHSGVEEGK